MCIVSQCKVFTVETLRFQRKLEKVFKSVPLLKLRLRKRRYRAFYFVFTSVIPVATSKVKGALAPFTYADSKKPQVFIYHKHDFCPFGLLCRLPSRVQKACMRTNLCWYCIDQTFRRFDERRNHPAYLIRFERLENGYNLVDDVLLTLLVVFNKGERVGIIDNRRTSFRHMFRFVRDGIPNSTTLCLLGKRGLRH